MSYIRPIQIEHATADVRGGLEGIQRALGRVPNMFGVMAHSPVALAAYQQLAGVTAKGKLNARQREQIALAVGQGNACDYCVAAHTAIGTGAGLDAAGAAAARQGKASDPRDAALLRLAQVIVAERGHVGIAELDAFKAAGFTDGDVLEVLVNVVLNIYTNYTNHIARTEVDFPSPAAV